VKPPFRLKNNTARAGRLIIEKRGRKMLRAVVRYPNIVDGFSTEVSPETRIFPLDVTEI
jgi:hypothetical protein